ncbi:GNAT family N-acetyltransferase [Virgibacillus doumboii]|uniref:GNAT family N-acetyltransferase n=1 Tax=Virgibacillus doumboii TaxID=2697503 RepID=UPI0019688362|nr:GNAT family N-acetyltransferase [Virgibacillus doumboii]
MNYNIEILMETDEKFSSLLHTKIKEFNNTHSKHHSEARKDDAVQPINIRLSNSEEKWIGGITAEVYWDWMEINDFWISENYRGEGLGGVLLEKTESIASKKGATKALLTTFDFQAHSYYMKKGYQVVGEINDYPPGSSFYTMAKTLNRENVNES